MSNGPVKTEELSLNRETVTAKMRELVEEAKTTVQTVTSDLQTEEFRVTGDAVIAKVKELVHEGSVRRITIKNEDGHVLAVFPLTAGVVGAVLLPMWAALSVLVALVTNCTILVERVEPTTPPA